MSNESFEPLPLLPALQSGRLRLRRLTQADIPSLFAIFGDPLVARYWGQAALKDEGEAAALFEAIQRLSRKQTLFQWGIELATGCQMIGTCTLSSIDFGNRRAEVGFAMGRAWWGQGYMGEALECLMTIAFDSMQLHKLTADTDPRNARSIRRLEALGFQRVGLFREHYLVENEAQDAVLYELLRAESRWSGDAAH